MQSFSDFGREAREFNRRVEKYTDENTPMALYHSTGARFAAESGRLT